MKYKKILNLELHYQLLDMNTNIKRRIKKNVKHNI